MFDAGAINSTLGLDLSPFATGMLQANAIAAVFPQVVQTFMANPLLGLIEVAEKAASAIKSAFLGVAQEAHQIAIESAIAGVSEQFFRKIADSAKISGIGVDELGRTFAILSRNAVNATEGNDQLANTFNKIGVSVTDAAGTMRPMEDLFNDLVNAISRMPSKSEQAQVAMTLLGRGGAALLPILKEGSRSFDEFADRVHAVTGDSFGGISEGAHKFAELEVLADKAMMSIKKAFTAPIFEAINEHADEFEAKIAQVAAAARDMIAPMAQGLLELIPTFLQIGGAIVSGMIETFNVLKPLVSAVMPLLSGLANIVGAVLGPAFKVLGTIIQAVSKPLQFILDLIGKVLSGIGSVIGAVGEFLGFGSSQSAAPTATPKATTEIKAVNIQVDGVDVNAASTAIANKIQPKLRSELRKQQSKLESQTAQEFTVRSL